MSVILGLWELIEPIKELLGGILAAALVVFGLYRKGRSDARKDMEQSAAKKAYTDARQREHIEDDIARRDPDQLDRMLNPWLRDG